jgi:hypothetical protein
LLLLAVAVAMVEPLMQAVVQAGYWVSHLNQFQ